MCFAVKHTAQRVLLSAGGSLRHAVIGLHIALSWNATLVSAIMAERAGCMQLICVTGGAHSTARPHAHPITALQQQRQHTQKHYRLLTCNEESLQHASLPRLVAESSVTLRSQSLRGRHDHICQAGHLEASNPCARCLQHAVPPTLPRLLWQCPLTLGCPLGLRAGKHLQSGQYKTARRITECKVVITIVLA